MFFIPKVDQKINYRNETCLFMQHPSATEGTVLSETGRRAKVYPLLCDGKQKYALKVFHYKYRKPEIKQTVDQMQSLLTKYYPDLFYDGAPINTHGLIVGRRGVINTKQDGNLISEFPPLEYAIMMPWVDGERWSNYVSNRIPISKTQSVLLAKNLCSVLADLESRGLAHCDISADNFIFTNDYSKVELVDIEEMFGPGLSKPSIPPGGTPGYTPEWVRAKGNWDKDADRYAAGVLLAEILGWQSQSVRTEKYGQTYFHASEIGTECKRLQVLLNELEKLDDRLAQLLTRVWFSSKFSDCPKISEWSVVINSLTFTRSESLAGISPSGTSFDDFIEPNKIKLNVEPKLPDPSQVTKYGGLTKNQFLALIFGLPITAIIIFSIFTPQNMGALWGTVQVVSLLAPMIYAALRKKWLTFGIFTLTAALVGAYLDVRGQNIHSFFEWASVAALAGFAFLGIMWIGIQSEQILTHRQIWRREIVSSAIGGLITACLMTGIMWGINSINFPYLIINLLLGAAGYLLGSYLNDVIISVRENGRKEN